MKPYQRILLVADPAMRRTPAFERAVWLTGITGAALHIGLFDRNPAIAALALVDQKGAQQARDAWLAQRRAWLAEVAIALRGKGLRVTTEAVWAQPLRVEVLSHVAEYRPDLVIKDVLRETPLRNLLLRPIDWHLLHDCTAPMLLVNTLDHAVPRRVIAAVDVSQELATASDFNGQIIETAGSLAAQCGAELHLAYCFDLPSETGGGLAATLTELYDTLRDRHRTRFDALAEAHGLQPERRHFLKGLASAALAEFAGDGRSDVLVVGAHQRKGIDRILLGSTTDAMLDVACCDVLVVNPGAV